MSEEKFDLGVMLEGTEEFIVRGTKYYVRPLYLGEVEEFTKDGLSIGPQLINLTDKNNREKVDKWLKRTVTDKDGNAMSLEILEKWTVKDLRRYMQKVIDISG